MLPIGRYLIAVAFIGLGIEHFVFQRSVTGRAPEWPASLPGGEIWAYVSAAIALPQTSGP